MQTEMRTYAALVASMMVCKIALLPAPFDPKTPQQQWVLQWWFIALVAVYGAIGVLLLRRTGFAGVATNRPGAQLALVLGLVGGVLSIGVDMLRPLEAVLGLQSAHHPLPEGILLYWQGAVVSEIWFHLLPMPLAVFVVSHLLMRGRHEQRVFWMAAIVIAAWEGRRFWTQPELWDAIELLRNLVGYASNLAAIWLFRRFGFLAAVAQRMTSYSVWHIAWPLLRV